MLIYTDDRFRPRRKSKKATTEKSLSPLREQNRRALTPQSKILTSQPFRRGGSQDIPSLETRVAGGEAKEVEMYTGDRLLGITILHKSCLQPVFSQEEAEDAAHMRR